MGGDQINNPIALMSAIRSSMMNEETKPKTETLVRLEKHIAEKPDRYHTVWWPDGSLHSATHLDSGVTYVVSETDECIGFIWYP